jgi:rRNA processing protein Gar1
MSKVIGKVAQIIGPVVDVVFDTKMPNYLKFMIH